MSNEAGRPLRLTGTRRVTPLCAAWALALRRLGRAREQVVVTEGRSSIGSKVREVVASEIDEFFR
jgi:hypothetical protein